MIDIMDQDHPGWETFRRILSLVISAPGKHSPGTVFVSSRPCDCTKSRPLVCEILKKHFPGVDIPATLAYFDDHGGYCDCEVLLNVI
jgi:hypothetical protein